MRALTATMMLRMVPPVLPRNSEIPKIIRAKRKVELLWLKNYLRGPAKKEQVESGLNRPAPMAQNIQGDPVLVNISLFRQKIWFRHVFFPPKTFV